MILESKTGEDGVEDVVVIFMYGCLGPSCNFEQCALLYYLTSWGHCKRDKKRKSLGPSSHFCPAFNVPQERAQLKHHPWRDVGSKHWQRHVVAVEAHTHVMGQD